MMVGREREASSKRLSEEASSESEEVSSESEEASSKSEEASSESEEDSSESEEASYKSEEVSSKVRKEACVRKLSYRSNVNEHLKTVPKDHSSFLKTRMCLF